MVTATHRQTMPLAGTTKTQKVATVCVCVCVCVFTKQNNKYFYFYCCLVCLTECVVSEKYNSSLANGARRLTIACRTCCTRRVAIQLLQKGLLYYIITCLCLRVFCFCFQVFSFIAFFIFVIDFFCCLQCFRCFDCCTSCSSRTK